jgi:hypothetical protein
VLQTGRFPGRILDSFDGHVSVCGDVWDAQTPKDQGDIDIHYPVLHHDSPVIDLFAHSLDRQPQLPTGYTV